MANASGLEHQEKVLVLLVKELVSEMFGASMKFVEQSNFPGDVSLFWGWQEIHMPYNTAYSRRFGTLGGHSLISVPDFSAQLLVPDAFPRLKRVSVPTLNMHSGFDIADGSYVVRWTMSPIKVDSIDLPMWGIQNRFSWMDSLQMTAYGSENHRNRVKMQLLPSLRIIQEFCNTPAEILALPGEELPVIASTELLISNDTNVISQWRKWWATQALQHHHEPEVLEWWAPTAETKLKGPRLAEDYMKRQQAYLDSL